MTKKRIKTIKFSYSPLTGTGYVLVNTQGEPVVRPDKAETIPTNENATEPQMNILLRSDEPKDRSHKHVEKKHKHNRGPVETRLDTKPKMGGKRMQPMTSKDRHDANRTLRSCVAILKSTTVRKILNIEFPDKFYGNVSTVVNPLEDMLGLNLPVTKTPLQYGSKRKPAQYTHHETFMLRGRHKKALTQNFTEPEILLPIDYCYELYGNPEHLCDTPMIDYMNKMDEVYSADAVHVSKEELEQAKKQALQQRFDDCVLYFYPPKTYEK